MLVMYSMKGSIPCHLPLRFLPASVDLGMNKMSGSSQCWGG